MIYNTGMQVGYWLILMGKWLFNRCYLAKKHQIQKRHAEDYAVWKDES